MSLEIYVVDNPEQLTGAAGQVKKGAKGHAPTGGAGRGRCWRRCTRPTAWAWRRPRWACCSGFFVAELPADEEDPLRGRPLILFNPEIVKSKGEQIGFEGCLSIPGWVGEVARHEQVTVKGLDERGKSVRYKVDGYLARVFQHEIDHLDGILFTDKLTDPATFRPVEVGQEEAAEMEAATS